MASPPSLPLRLGLRAPPCSLSGPFHLYSSNGSPQIFASRRAGRRLLAAAEVERLVLRSPAGAGRRSGRTGSLACRCSYDAKNEPPSSPPDKVNTPTNAALGTPVKFDKVLAEWPVLRRWDVPWEWPTVSLTMVACALSFLLTGMLEQSVLEQLGFQAGDATLDEKAEVLLLGQFSTTLAVLGVIFGITNAFRPFSDDIFRYDRLTSPFITTDWLIKYQHCLFAGYHRSSGTNSGGDRVSRISNGVIDYVVSYSIFCPYHCCGVCLRSSYTWRISSAFYAWYCVRIFVCSHSQSSHTYYNTCCLEFRSNIVANLSSVSRIRYQGTVAGIMKFHLVSSILSCAACVRWTGSSAVPL